LRRCDVLVDLLTGLGVRKQHHAFGALERARLFEDDQVRIVLDVIADVFYDRQPVVDVGFTRLVVDFGGDEPAVFLVLLVGRDKGLLNSFHHHLARHAFFGGELSDGSHEFTFHAGSPSARSLWIGSSLAPYNKRSGGYPLRKTVRVLRRRRPAVPKASISQP
jgi:hypothetical protein